MPQEKNKIRSQATANIEALATLRSQSIQLLHIEFNNFLNELIEHLLVLSAKAKQTSTGYSLFYDAMSAVKRNKATIAKSLTSRLEIHYEDVTRKTENPFAKLKNSVGADNLDLVNIDEFETNLRVDKIIDVGVSRYRVALECLTIRLAHLMKLDPNLVSLPVHIEKISKAFPVSLRGQEIPKEAIPDILLFFQQELIAKLDNYYESLNRPLREAGILPDLEQQIKEKGSLLKKVEKITKRPKPKPKSTSDDKAHSAEASSANGARATGSAGAKSSPAANTDTPRSNIGQAGGAPTGEAPGQFSTESLYNSVMSALNFKREAESRAGGAPAASAPAQTLADMPSVANALSILQQDPDIRSAVGESASLRNYLMSNQESIAGLSGTSGLNQESVNQLDLVDNLFGAIQSQVDVTAELKPALGNLQIPLAKLALLEPQFFVDKQHSARGVVDKLAQLAASANFPNKALEKRIESIIDKIITDYDDDSVVFDAALTNVDKLVAQQKRAQIRNLDRVVKTQEGQEKLKEAHKAVQAEINKRVRSPAAPEVLVKLIETGWRDLLVLTHLRDGPDSEIWSEQVKTLDLLSSWLGEDASSDDTMVQRSLEAEPLIDLISQEISTALPTNIGHEPVLEQLREIFSGQQSIKMVSVVPFEDSGDPTPKEIAAKIKSLPRINRWVKRVNQLEKGTWLTYKDKQGQKRRMQLAWISDDRDRFIFANERGQRHADLSAVQLARRLSRGAKAPTPADKLSLVDQSMYNTLEHVQKSLSFSRNHDSLTKLINYDTFLRQVERALRHAERRHSQHAILCLNIDQFKLVNEVYDQESGDLILLEFAKLLSQLHGKKSSSCRVRGDEFAVLLLDRTVHQAVKYANQIRADIESSSVAIGDENVTFTVSIGVAPICDYSPGVNEIVRQSNSAMHLAKERGRNQVVEFEQDQAEIDNYRKKQQETKSSIQTTLETKRFALRAQPIVQTAVDGSGPESQHFELLLGLTNKDGSLSSPVEFIESAERYGYMGLVDRWVVREAFSWINELMDSQKIVPNLSINLSGSSITDDSFMDYLLEQISEFGVGTSKLCFEITETGTISNLVKAADFVTAFRNIGCKFSIDDFGTGLASHNYLRELPVDYVKIDGTFIKDIDSNRNDYAMTRSINDLAHFLGQKTIAESVENRNIIEKLTEIGVDYLQGWGIGKPKLLKDITAELDNIEK